MIRYLLVILSLTFALLGCNVRIPDAATVYQPSLKHEEMTATAKSAVTHQDNAAAAVKQARDIAVTIPEAKPVVPPLDTASDELAKAKVDNATLQGQIIADQKATSDLLSQLVTAQRQNAGLTKDNKALTASNTKLQNQWSDSWFAGKFWFWAHLVMFFFGAGLTALFVAEFFFGLNIHPITWIVEGAIWIAKAAVNVIKATISEASATAAFLKGRFSK